MKSRIYILLLFLMIGHGAFSQNNKRIMNVFEYEDCSCVDLDLKIHNGLYGSYGAQQVSDLDETTKGAVTVANLNDTDGDGTIDKDDNAVLAGSSGRSEVDLMKLVISSTGALPECPRLKLSYDASKIKLWNKATKEEPALDIHNLGDLPKTIWVEAIKTSGSVRDISITADFFEPADPSTVGDFDNVKATAIWVEKNAVYTPNGSRTGSPSPSSVGINNPGMISFMTTIGNSVDGSLYGFGEYRPIPFAPTMDGFFGGRILFDFELKPSGIESELSNLGIKYDISRRIARNNNHLNYSSSSWIATTSSFPMQAEEGNDDSECSCPTGPSDMIDEDAIPSGNRIFSYDAPSEIALGSGRAFSLRSLDFQEFARVSFGIDISGNVQEGSKCSESYDWNLDYGLISNSTINSTDPYNPDLQLLTQTSGGSVVSSTPRRVAPIGGNGNGPISFSSLSASPVVTYILRFEAVGNRWELLERTATGSNQVAISNTSVTGPWTISHSTVTLSIAQGSNVFVPGETFLFNIVDLTSTSNTMTAN